MSLETDTIIAESLFQIVEISKNLQILFKAQNDLLDEHNKLIGELVDEIREVKNITGFLAKDKGYSPPIDDKDITDVEVEDKDSPGPEITDNESQDKTEDSSELDPEEKNPPAAANNSQQKTTGQIPQRKVQARPKRKKRGHSKRKKR